MASSSESSRVHLLGAYLVSRLIHTEIKVRIFSKQTTQIIYLLNRKYFSYYCCFIIFIIIVVVVDIVVIIVVITIIIITIIVVVIIVITIIIGIIFIITVIIIIIIVVIIIINITGIIQIVRGNLLPPLRLLFPISSKSYFICIIPRDRIIHTTTFVTPVVEHWLEQEIAQCVHHEGSIK